MSLVTINIKGDFDALEKKLDIIINQNIRIMGTIQDLNNKITELETAWTTENEEIKAKLDEGTAEIARLREVIANQGNTGRNRRSYLKT